MNTCRLYKIKCVYSRLFILGFIHPKVKFNIMKYNNKMKTDFKSSLSEYYKNYSPIRVEIKPYFGNKHGRYMNIYNYEKKYIRVFFDNKEELNYKQWLVNGEKVNKITLYYSHKFENYVIFKNCDNINIKINNNGRNNFDDFSDLFFGCNHLVELDLGNVDSSNVIIMQNMFRDCFALKKLNLNCLNTEKVTDMSNMFSYCNSLEELNIDNFNTKNVIYMNSMFSDCKSLRYLNLNHFNTNNVMNFRCMFYNCINLIELNINNFVIKANADCECMFSNIPLPLKNYIKFRYKNIPNNAFY